MKPDKFLMFMPLLPAFVVFVWGVEQSHAQKLSAPGQFEIIKTVNQADRQASAKQARTIRAPALDSGGALAVAPSLGQTPPTTPKERSKPCR
ncbi:MAG: hypothetical protein M0P70_17715 [Desulfobulbaceae bacterium]|nr:hypothetical protein [Desulfobulbaceae bacterium]